MKKHIKDIQRIVVEVHGRLNVFHQFDPNNTYI